MEQTSKQNVYTGMTWGPIVGTMMLMSSPASQWAASSLFSWLANELLLELTSGEDGIQPEKFLLPVFTVEGAGEGRRVVLTPPDDAAAEDGNIIAVMRSRGVGLLHDRIIISGEHRKKCCEAKNAVLNTLGEKLAKDLFADSSKNAEVIKKVTKWVRGYMHIYGFARDIGEEAPLLCIGQILDALDMEPNFVTSETENYLLTLFENALVGDPKRYSANVGRYRNDAIKNSFLVEDLISDPGEWMLSKGKDAIRDLGDIAGIPEEGAVAAWKSSSYYAVLASDGDHMGKVLQNLTARYDIQKFSKTCPYFCAKVSKKILDYGGMPIYAGGDDIRAILPLTGEDRKTLFSLVAELAGDFDKVFKFYRKETGGAPTVSFGISIQFVKSPLYEAFAQAEELLENAKARGRNRCLIRLQKHTGSVTEMEIPKLLSSPQSSDGTPQAEAAPEACNKADATPAGACEKCEDGKSILKALDETVRGLRDAEAAKANKALGGQDPDVDNKKSDGSATELFLAGMVYHLEENRPLIYEALKRGHVASSEKLEPLFDSLFDNKGQEPYKEHIERIRKLMGGMEDISKKAMSDRDKGTLEGNKENSQADHVRKLCAPVHMIRFMLEKGGKKNDR